MKVLITGGAGFLGTHLSRRLLREGCEVTILDNFNPQVHGAASALSPDVGQHVRLIRGDVRDIAALSTALQEQEVVVHFAAETGTGQSMYEVARYGEVNIGGTANLMQVLVNGSANVSKLIVASSRAVYGEGKYHCNVHGTVCPATRNLCDMQAGLFEPRCPACGTFCTPLPTTEDTPFQPASFYGLTKQVQEQMAFLFAATMGLGAFALRYQNVYGPGQSLRNPYTGILAIFSGQARRDQPISIFEDGRETRDFVYVEDAVEATWRCIATTGQHIAAVNVGSGARTSVKEVAEQIVAYFQSRSEVNINGAFRAGDIRHNCADLTRARALLGFAPQWSLANGLREFLKWSAGQGNVLEGFGVSLDQMKERGLFHV